MSNGARTPNQSQPRAGPCVWMDTNNNPQDGDTRSNSRTKSPCRWWSANHRLRRLIACVVTCSLTSSLRGSAHFTEESDTEPRAKGPQPRLPNSDSPLQGLTQVSARHRGLLNPCGHRFRKRVLCPRPGAQRPAAQAGPFPVERPLVPSLAAIQTGLAGSKGPLAARLANSRRARGRAGHPPLGLCPALPSPVGHGQGHKGKPRGGSATHSCCGLGD